MGVHTFPKGICPKVNVIARLEYELAYYDFAVHRFNHYTTRIPPKPNRKTPFVFIIVERNALLVVLLLKKDNGNYKNFDM